MNAESVHDLLAAWRAAERDLEEATDPEVIDALAEVVERLRREYQHAVDAASGADIRA